MNNLFHVHVNICTSTHSVAAHHSVFKPVDSLNSLEKRLQRQKKLRKDLLDCAITDGDLTSIEIILQYTNSTILYPIFPVVSTLPIRRRKKIRALKKILHQQRALSIFRLFKAAHDGDVEICKLLIRYDVNVNSTLFYDSPLNTACENGQYLCVSVLLENGADVNAGDRYNGVTPIMAAVRQQFRMTDDFVINRLNCIGLLISYNADVNQTENYGNTALMYSAWSYLLSEYLLTLECNPDVILSWACHRQDRCRVELLLNYNADLNVPSQNDHNLSVLQTARTQLALHGVSTHDVWKMILEAEHNRLHNNATDWIRLARLDRRQNPQAGGRQS